jgi:hypothetical protein
MATYASDILTASFMKVGVEAPTTAQNASALFSLNSMITSWGAEGLLYSVVSESKAMTIADGEYTIGSGGQWDTARPLGIRSCYLRDGDNYDHPVGVMSGNDYALLTNKSFSARPNFVYYLPEYPLGKLIFNAVPDYAYTMYCEFVKNFTAIAATTAEITLPGEYLEALIYNLSVSLAEDWDRNVGQTVLANAARTKEIVERNLASQRAIPRAKFDFSRIGDGRNDSGYNVVTDELIDGGAF